MEQQLLNWHSDSSDEEGFQLVSHKKSKYRKKKVTICASNDKNVASTYGSPKKKKEGPMISSRTNPGRQNKTKGKR